MEARNLEIQLRRRENLERQAREAAVNLSDAWARVVRAHDAVLKLGGQSAPGLEKKMVEEFTNLGSRLNALLVLPINEPTRENIMKINGRVEGFRRDPKSPDGGIGKRDDVAKALLDLFKTLRDTDFLRRPIV